MTCLLLPIAVQTYSDRGDIRWCKYGNLGGRLRHMEQHKDATAITGCR
ncbi:hypothetical protein B0I18_1115 [Taibaiella chishuiensis]|uniref:Uncharacterized protein n=1 Tax=Taibaiella chishuiensis TaxID=1434707 RepID=A0A2P8CWU5_9BACT|nr:hypothetical protein B0I18_1115 [Taibaiella chishuiensis]